VNVADFLGSVNLTDVMILLVLFGFFILGHPGRCAGGRDLSILFSFFSGALTCRWATSGDN